MRSALDIVAEGRGYIERSVAGMAGGGDGDGGEGRMARE
jgi:hypothetical protein